MLKMQETRPTYVLLYKNNKTTSFERNLGREPWSFWFVEALVKKQSEENWLTLLTFPAFADWQEKINQWIDVECEIKVNGVKDVYYVRRIS